MKRFWKVLAVMLGVVGMVCAFSGCSRDTAGSDKDVPISDIVEKLKSGLEWEYSMIQATDAMIEGWYSFDSEKVEEFTVYVTDFPSVADEIVVVKLSDKGYLSEAETILKDRVDNRKKEFEGYSPTEAYKAENAVITSHGNYVALIVGNDFDKADSVFEDCFK
jgi:hypothetical protein